MSEGCKEQYQPPRYVSSAHKPDRQTDKHKDQKHNPLYEVFRDNK